MLGRGEISDISSRGEPLALQRTDLSSLHVVDPERGSVATHVQDALLGRQRTYRWTAAD